MADLGGDPRKHSGEGLAGWEEADHKAGAVALSQGHFRDHVGGADSAPQGEPGIYPPKLVPRGEGRFWVWDPRLPTLPC